MINRTTSLNRGTYKQPNIFGYYGNFGGAYIPEMLHRNVEELKDRYIEIIYDAAFQKELNIGRRPRGASCGEACRGGRAEAGCQCSAAPSAMSRSPRSLRQSIGSDRSKAGGSNLAHPHCLVLATT